MRKMPKMIQEYREKVYELREKTRKKKGRTEEELYLIATGKMKQQGPHWQIFKEGETSKKDAPNRDAARRDAKKDSSKKWRVPMTRVSLQCEQQSLFYTNHTLY